MPEGLAGKLGVRGHRRRGRAWGHRPLSRSPKTGPRDSCSGGSALHRGAAALLELLAASAGAWLVPPGLPGRVLLRGARISGLGAVRPGRDARYSPLSAWLCLLGLLPEFPGLAGPAGLLADERQPFRDVLGFPDSGDGVAGGAGSLPPAGSSLPSRSIPIPRPDLLPATTGTAPPPSPAVLPR